MTTNKISRHQSIGQILLAQGLITRIQLAAAVAEQKNNPYRKLASILVAQGAITDGQAKAALESQATMDESPILEAVAILQRAMKSGEGEGVQQALDNATKLREAVSAALARLPPAK